LDIGVLGYIGIV